MIAPNGNGLAPEGAQPDDPTPGRASATVPNDSTFPLPRGATPRRSLGEDVVERFRVSEGLDFLEQPSAVALDLVCNALYAERFHALHPSPLSLQTVDNATDDLFAYIQSLEAGR